MHHSVLMEEFLSLFAKRTIKVFVDGTVGSGGHAEALLMAHREIERFYGIDRDPLSLETAAARLLPFKEKVTLLQGSFRDMPTLVKERAVDGILLDLGISSLQLEEGGRGFSLYKDEPLDMRMDQREPLNAATIVNSFSEKELARIFWEYGEEKRARRAARAIVEARAKKKIRTTGELCDILRPVLTWGGRVRRHIHPLTQVFQALRIAVNDELEAVKEAIPLAFSLLAPEGRLAVMTFHSGEDRVVKTAMRDLKQRGDALLLTKKPINPSEKEKKENPRSRSSRLRSIERPL